MEEAEKMGFTFQAEPCWLSGLSGTARCRTSTAPLAGWKAPGLLVPQNQKQSGAFQGNFLTWNSISGDFVGFALSAATFSLQYRQ